MLQVTPAAMDENASQLSTADIRTSRARRNGVSRSRRVRRYICSVCTESFTRSEHCRRHELCHRTQKPYACGYCDLKSSRRDVISRHTKKFHQSENEESVHGPADFTAAMENDGSYAAVNGNQPIIHSSNFTTEADAANVMSAHFSNASFDSDCASSKTPIAGALLTPSTSVNYNIELDATYNDASQCFPPSGDQFELSGDPEGLDLETNYEILDDYLFQFLNPLPFIPPFDSTWRDSSNPKLQAVPGTENDYHATGLFSELSDADIELAKAQVAAFDVEGRLSDFRFPGRYRAIRFLKGYFNYFSPHTPIVHRATFNLARSPAPLMLAVLACGAIHMNVAEIGVDLHHAVLKLLAENDDLVNTGEKESEFQLWEFQARLLACQFGLFSSDLLLQRQAQLAFSRLPVLAEEAKMEAYKLSSMTQKETLIWVETINRCVAWTGVLAAVLMSNEDVVAFRFRVKAPDIALPCAENLWSLSAADFQKLPRANVYSTESLLKLIRGESLDCNVSPFGLLTLISGLLHYICSMKNLDEYSLPRSSHLNEASLESALTVWEEAWKKHPLSRALPEGPQGPLMADSIVILNSAYYHLYASNQLRALKAFARLPTNITSKIELEQLCSLQCHPGLMKALNRALRILLLRVRVGIRNLAKTAPLTYVCYGPHPAYEGGLLIFWYFLRLHIFESSEVPDVTLLNLFEEVIAESDGEHEIPARRELLPLMLYQELFREKWVWQSATILGENLGSVIQRIEDQ